MKIRHIIFLLAASAAILSCGKETFDIKPGSPVPITFSASVSTQTKAYKPDDPSLLISEGNEAGVFCTRAVGSESQQIMFNRQLTCDAVPDPATPGEPYSSVWNYTPVEYWQETGNYYFTGVFPFTSSDATIDNTYYLNVSYQAGSNTDMMVARAYRDAATNTDPVNLEFKHTTAAVRVLFGKASGSSSDGYTLTAFQIEKLIASGTFKVLTRITDPAGDPISLSNWTLGAVSDTPLSRWIPESQSERKTIPYPDDAANPDGYLQMGWYYMVPQTLNEESAIRFSVAYNDEDPVETVLSITDRDGIPGADTWIPNCVYNYYITLSQSGLDVTVRAVPWDEVQVNTDDMNFEG